MKGPNRKSIAAIATLAILSSGSAVAAQGSPTVKPKILIVISSKNALKLRDGKTYPTGYYFNELTVPVRKFVDRGYDVAFSIPRPGQVT